MSNQSRPRHGLPAVRWTSPPTILTTRMTVSKIEPSRHAKGRILVYLDSGDILKATEQETLTFSLYPGRVLSEEELCALRAAAGRSGARVRAAEMIGARALSKKELCRRLVQKGESEEKRLRGGGTGWRISARWTI